LPDRDSTEFDVLYVTVVPPPKVDVNELRAELVDWNGGPVLRCPEFAVVMLAFVDICGNVEDGNVAPEEVDVEVECA